MRTLCGSPFQTDRTCCCPRPRTEICAPHLLPLSQELALRPFTKAPCYWGFEAEVPISRLITESVRQLGASCCSTGTAPKHVTCSEHTSAHQFRSTWPPALRAGPPRAAGQACAELPRAPRGEEPGGPLLPTCQHREYPRKASPRGSVPAGHPTGTPGAGRMPSVCAGPEGRVRHQLWFQASGAPPQHGGRGRPGQALPRFHSMALSVAETGRWAEGLPAVNLRGVLAMARRDLRIWT